MNPCPFAFYAFHLQPAAMLFGKGLSEGEA
jgi:hypothetical protein